MKKIILHIGRHKAGTTALQNSFIANKKALKTSGIYYPELGVRECAHHLISERLNPQLLDSESNADFLCDELIEAFIEEITNCDEQVILVSSEAFQNCRPSDVRRLFAGFELTIVFYLREQISYLESSYLQEVHATNYSDSIINFENDRFSADYLTFYIRWSECFFSEHIIVRPYEKRHLINGDIVVDFFSGVLISELGYSINFVLPELDGYTGNSSLRGDCVSFKLRLNSFSREGGHPDPVLYRSLGRLSQKKEKVANIVTRELAEVVEDKYAASNKKLRKLLSWDSDCLILSVRPDGAEIPPLGPKECFLFVRDLIDFYPECGYLYAQHFGVVVKHSGASFLLEFCDNLIKDSMSYIYLDSTGNLTPVESFKTNKDKSFVVPSELFDPSKDSIGIIFDDKVQGEIVMTTIMEGYQKRVDDQVRQFSDLSILKKLPKINQYWMSTHVAPKIKDVFGVKGALDIYVDNFFNSLSKQESTRKILSIGAGDAQLEINIAKKICGMGINDFTIVCTDISSVRLERAEEQAIAHGVEDLLEFRVVDVNTMDSREQYAGIMAHHALHHIVELERLFSMISSLLHKDGVFVSVDMIGRNGHMRWQEAESLIEKIWGFIPDHYKYQHQFGKQHEKFVNWDCAQKGFEGVRAQDILPLMIDNFDFERFFSYGNLPDIFVERGYGHNLDIDNPKDKGFIDFLEYLNELLIDIGYLKPTIIFATLRKKGTLPKDAICHKHWTPEFCARPTTDRYDARTSVIGHVSDEVTPS